MGGGGQVAPWGGVQEYYAKPSSYGRPHVRPWEQGMPNLAGYMPGLPMPVREKVGGHHRPPSASRDHEDAMDKRALDELDTERKEGMVPKYAHSEVDTKRAKQQYAQRSRVRKLQYIAELEGKVQALQVGAMSLFVCIYSIGPLVTSLAFLAVIV
ncbi:hypothetical protein ACQ4PT_019936 [Festuca glaucescens]